MSDCIFCKIIENKIPAQKVLESELAVVLQDIQPQAPHHYLVIPKKHFGSLNDLNHEARTQLMPELYKLADTVALQKGFKDQGYRTVINNQALAGQTVFHLHMHVIAGAKLSGKMA